jgi:hypothetical protein
MKIKSSRDVYDQAAWNGKDRGYSGCGEAVEEFGPERAF